MHKMAAHKRRMLKFMLNATYSVSTRRRQRSRGEKGRVVEGGRKEGETGLKRR
jgi:hypothetical protein